MKVEVNETLLKEFGRVYNAWNKEHGIDSLRPVEPEEKGDT